MIHCSSHLIPLVMPPFCEHKNQRKCEPSKFTQGFDSAKAPNLNNCNPSAGNELGEATRNPVIPTLSGTPVLGTAIWDAAHATLLAWLLRGLAPLAMWAIPLVANLVASCHSCLQSSDLPIEQLFPWLARRRHWPGPFPEYKRGSTQTLCISSSRPSRRLDLVQNTCSNLHTCNVPLTSAKIYGKFISFRNTMKIKSTATLQFFAHALCHQSVEILSSMHFIESNHYWIGTSGSPHVPKAQSC